VGRVDARLDIREFLTSRRAKITPERAGLPAYGTNRRVKGLRREEVAMLAGISVEYYTRLERGNAGGVSEDVLEGVARALQLDEAERAHLFDLVRAANATSGATRRRPAQERVRPTVQRLLDSITAPAYVRNGRLDLLAANPLGHALYAPVFEDTTGAPNTARFIFLNPRASGFFHDWELIANDAVAILRAEAGRDPYDRRLSDLIGELSTRSDEFRGRWAAHNVKFHRTGTKQLHHPIVGNLTLTYEALELTADRGQRILVYTAEPESPSDDALKLLATWSATTPLAEPHTDATRGGSREL
jgi:transcriptional regulator with XRE-family HTH domain